MCAEYILWFVIRLLNSRDLAFTEVKEVSLLLFHYTFTFLDSFIKVKSKHVPYSLFREPVLGNQNSKSTCFPSCCKKDGVGLRKTLSFVGNKSLKIESN